MINSNSLVMPYLEERSTKNILPLIFQATSRKNFASNRSRQTFYALHHKLFIVKTHSQLKVFCMIFQCLPVYKGFIKTKIKGFMILAARMKLWNGHVQWPICCNICRENFLETTYIYVGLYYALVFNTVYFSTSTLKMP